MALQFTQKEIESDLKDILKHGDIRQISLISGIGETYLASQIDPNDERKSCAFVLLQIACALDEIDANRGEEFWNALCDFRAQSKKYKTALALCARAETAKFNKESADVVNFQIADAAPEEKSKEIAEAERQLGVLKNAVQHELEAKRSQQIAENALNRLKAA